VTTEFASCVLEEDSNAMLLETGIVGAAIGRRNPELAVETEPESELAIGLGPTGVDVDDSPVIAGEDAIDTESSSDS
jgi:hypothetical protein